jgi:hypothetical protein
MRNPFVTCFSFSVSKYLTISWRIPSGGWQLNAPIFLPGFCMFVCSSKFSFNFSFCSVCMFSSLWSPSLILQVLSVSEMCWKKLLHKPNNNNNNNRKSEDPPFIRPRERVCCQQLIFWQLSRLPSINCAILFNIPELGHQLSRSDQNHTTNTCFLSFCWTLSVG